MSSGSYGISIAAKLIEQGKYDEAIAEATRAIEKDANDPEPWFERASAAAMIEKFAAAADDFARAYELDREEGVLDDDVVDDGFFSALLGAARAEAVDAGVARLDRYAKVFPSGRHVRDASDWQRRLRGELKTEFVKRRVED